jgi:hypothetical protein|tara:strand:- start:806 stop:1000 length:195 start_codon:yes stop_codon:yes gene_type:complete
MTSSWIQDLSFDSANGSVTMTTKTGRIYTYASVGAETAKNWEGADSAGSYHNAHIRGAFEIEQA